MQHSTVQHASTARRGSTAPRGRPTRRAAASITAAVLAVAVALAALSPVAPLGAQTAAPAPTLDWLEAELANRGGTLPGPVGDTTDWGLTADVALALFAGGRNAGPPFDAATAVLGALRSYTTWDDIDPSLSGVRLAGPLAKTLLVATTAGLDPTDVDGVDLEMELRSLQRLDGTDAGRFSDRNPHAPDAATVFGHATALLALSRTDDGVPVAASSFLAAQQCPDGGFRLEVGPCSPGESDSDVTAVALQALRVSPAGTAVDGALARGLGWLLAAQLDDGSFRGSGSTAIPNANSTGLAAQTLRLLGRPEAADRAAQWITDAVLLGDAAAGTPAAGDRGAIAYVPERLAAALVGGIPAQQRDQWRRSGAQAVLGLGLPGFGAPVDAGPVVPSTVPTTITVPPSTGPPATNPPSSVAPTTAPADPSTGPSDGAPSPTPLIDGTTPATPAVASDASGAPSSPATASVAGAAVRSPSVASAPSSGAATLATTGSETPTVLGAALVLIGLGAMLVAGARPFAARSRPGARR